MNTNEHELVIKKESSRFSWLHSWPALIALAAACFRLASPDVPLGLAWGRAIYERGALPATNVFSYINHDYAVLLDKWLFQLIIYMVHLASGPAGLVWLRVALLATALFAAAKAAKIHWNRTPHAFLAVCFTIALLNRCYVRAELVTWAAVPLTLCLMPLVARGEKKGWILLIVLQSLWANSHGYWIVGPLLWAAAAIGSSLHPLLHKLGLSDQHGPTRQIKRRLMIAAFVALAAASLTPYGPETLAHPVRLAFELRTDDILSNAVDDFGSPLEAFRRGGTIPFWACCVMGIAGIVAVIRLAKARQLDGAKLSIFTLGLVLGLPLYRNMTIMAVCSLPLVADWLRGNLPTSENDKPTFNGARRWLYATAAVPALLWLGATFTGWGPATDYSARRPGFGWHIDRYPIAAADWIARNIPDAKIWNDFGEGGWLNWRLGEGHTFIDGNTDGYPLSFLRVYHELWRGTEIQPWLKASAGIQAALVDHGRSDHALGLFLTGISWLDSFEVGYADKIYAVIIPVGIVPQSPKAPKSSLQKDTARRIKAGPHKDDFSLNNLTSTPPEAPRDMYARSGRLAIWLYPEDPKAREHFEKTREKPRMNAYEHE